MNEPHLSDRERTVLLLAAEGLTDKEIARSLGLSHKTIGTYWDRMREKFSASSRTQVLAQFLRIQLGENVLDGEFCLKLFSEWHDGVWVVDKDGNTVYANDVAKTLIGTSGELTPLSLGNGNSAKVKRLISTKSDATTIEVQHAVGSAVKHLQLRAMPFRDGRGRSTATLVHLQDLSEHRLLVRNLSLYESTLQFLIECGGDCVARFDSELRVLDVNPTFCAVHGTSKSDLIGESISDLPHIFVPTERWVSNLTKALKSARRMKFTSEVPNRSKRATTFVMADCPVDCSTPSVISVSRCFNRK